VSDCKKASPFPLLVKASEAFTSGSLLFFLLFALVPEGKKEVLKKKGKRHFS
jgi:hypothetical protein